MHADETSMSLSPSYGAGNRMARATPFSVRRMPGCVSQEAIRAEGSVSNIGEAHRSMSRTPRSHGGSVPTRPARSSSAFEAARCVQRGRICRRDRGPNRDRPVRTRVRRLCSMPASVFRRQTGSHMMSFARLTETRIVVLSCPTTRRFDNRVQSAVRTSWTAPDWLSTCR